MPDYQTPDPGEAFDQHVRSYFAGHAITRQRWPVGPMESRIPGFAVYEVGPGPRFAGWSYLSSGCWRATAHGGHGLEFVLSTNSADSRHVEVVTIAAYYHAGVESQRLDLGHTVPIGEAWVHPGTCDHFLVSLPYTYGPDLEECSWETGHLRVLALMPITAAERSFKVENGVESLEQRLENAAIDFANPLRGSAV